MNSEQKCEKHSNEFTKICLAEDCQLSFLICEECDLNLHKHSKTQISLIKDIKEKLKTAWEPKQSSMDGYVKKSRLFYENLRKQINKLIDEDQRVVQNILSRVKYHHLPVQANSAAYIDLMKSEFDHLDKNTIVTLVNEAENGEENKDLQKQKQISNFLDIELKKINDKVLTLKYILLSKKLETEMLIPKLSQPSKVADNDQFTKVYSLFNSRKMPIRSAKMIYSAKDNDFSSDSFYNNCIGVHNCLVIAKTKNNKVYGGYCPNPLVYHDKDEMTQEVIYQSDETKRSFIFSITNLKSYSLKDSHKALIYKKNADGPSFGVDLSIGKQVTSSIGNSYESPQGIQVDSLESRVYLLQGEKVEADNFEVWQISF